MPQRDPQRYRLTTADGDATMSKALHAIVAVAATIGGVLLVAHVLRSLQPASTHNEHALTTAVTPPPEQRANLSSGRSSATVVQSDEAVSEVPSSPPGPADDRAASPSGPAFSMPQLAADVQIAFPEVAGQIAEAERDMALQSKDPVRSAAMEARIYSEIAQKALGLKISYLQADCRITLCRLQLTLPKSFLDKKFGNVPLDAVWTGREPAGFFIKALDLEWRYTTAFGGLDRYGTPVVLGYVAMPSSPTAP